MSNREVTVEDQFETETQPEVGVEKLEANPPASAFLLPVIEYICNYMTKRDWSSSYLVTETWHIAHCDDIINTIGVCFRHLNVGIVPEWDINLFQNFLYGTCLFR